MVATAVPPRRKSQPTNHPTGSPSLFAGSSCKLDETPIQPVPSHGQAVKTGKADVRQAFTPTGRR